MQSTQARTCTIDGCDGRHKARGLCLRHYQLQWASENRDKTNAASRASKARKPDYYREQNAQWWRDNPDYDRQRYAQDRDRILNRNREYRRLHPERRRAAVQKWAEAHRAEIRRRSREYARLNPEKRRQIEARRRARRRSNAGFVVTERDVARLLLRQQGLCSYCSTPLSSRYHLDHIVPLARGGHHAIGNLAAACPACNLSKGRSTLTEWRMRHQRT